MCRKSNVWTPSALQYLRENYATTPNHVIAKALGVTREYISKTGKELGLKKLDSCWKLTKEIKKEIVRLYPDHSYSSISEKLSISISSVYNYICFLVKNDETFQKRSKQDDYRLISKHRKELIKKERGWNDFCLPQKTKIKVGKAPNKSAMRRKLRKRGCYDIDHGGMQVFITKDEGRDISLEKKAAGMGFEIYYPTGEETDDEIEYEQIM